jgi:ribose/xylose/arabinose/galactoside ABC-type transport system permease subunit
MAESSLTAPAAHRTHGPAARLLGSQAFWVTIATLLITIAMTLTSDAFASYNNFFNTTRNFAFIGIMALGQTLVIITGGIDLAVGSVMGLSGIVFGMLMGAGYSFWVSTAVGLLVALAAGAVNGYLIAYLRMSAFVVTLGMLSIARSLALVVSNNQMVYQFGPDEALLFRMGGGETFGIANPVLILLALTLVFGFILNFTAWGRYVYAIGGNEEAARLSGIAAGRVKIVTYAVSGLLAGIAAVLYVAQYRQGKPDAGAGLELDAIAAVVIGGTSLMGGRGSLTGTFCGVLIFGLLSNILQLHNINSNLQLVLKGMIIIGTVLVQERNAGDLLAYLRLPGAAHKETAAAKRPSQETRSLNLGGNKK